MMNSDRFFGFLPSNLFIGQVHKSQYVMRTPSNPQGEYTANIEACRGTALDAPE
jgi:hypothetical protein